VSIASSRTIKTGVGLHVVKTVQFTTINIMYFIICVGREISRKFYIFMSQFFLITERRWWRACRNIILCFQRCNITSV